MKKLIYILPLLLCSSNIMAKKSFGSGFAWGTFAGFTTGTLVSEARRYQQPCKPSLYIVHPPKPRVFVVPEPVVQPRVVYYEQPAQPKYIAETRIIKDTPKCNVEVKQLELQIIKEENRKKELALREKELDIQLFKLKQV